MELADTVPAGRVAAACRPGISTEAQACEQQVSALHRHPLVDLRAWHQPQCAFCICQPSSVLEGLLIDCRDLPLQAQCTYGGDAADIVFAYSVCASAA